MSILIRLCTFEEFGPKDYHKYTQVAKACAMQDIYENILQKFASFGKIA